MYTIKSILPTSEYENIIYTQSISLENINGFSIWIEDNDMLIKNSDINKKLDKKIYLCASCSGFYLRESDIPVNKQSFTFKCKYLDKWHVDLNGFVYTVTEKLLKPKQGEDIWVSIYMRDLKLLK
jgi:hypothetical protein